MTETPRLAELREEFVRQFPSMAHSVDRGRAEFGEPWAAEFEELLVRLYPVRDDLAKAVRAYIRFSLDIMRSMKKFEKEREYSIKTYAEAAERVYYAEEYMLGEYLPGLMLSHYLWPHHYRHNVFFRTMFLPNIAGNPEAKWIDIGIGTGFYSRIVLDAVRDSRGTGYDISDASIKYTRKQLQAFGCDDRYDIRKTNIIESPPTEPVDFLMSIEVLEHLEDPVEYMRALRKILKPGGKAFITAAITAPNPDHIYLYWDSEEVLKEIRQAGFKLEQYHCAPGYAPKNDEPVPTISAFIVT
jgi:2-polyprenyl-3-methyl-5-hydroxy-6-metoxy-1,4-benzoquinol methylase